MPTPPPKPQPPRYHVSTATAPTLNPGTVPAIRLANVPAAEWEWLRGVLEARGWRPY